VRAHQGELPADAQGVLQLAVRDVQRHRAGALPGQPAGALGRSGPQLQDVAALQFLGRAEQLGLHLVQPLGSPHETVVAEEGAVLDLVLVGVAVPPAPIGSGALADAGLPPGRLRFGRFGLLDDRLPRRTLPSSRTPVRRRTESTGAARVQAHLTCGSSAARANCAGYAAIRPGWAASCIDPARLPPYATSCAASLRASDVAGCARVCCMSPRFSRRRPQFLMGRFLGCPASTERNGLRRSSTYDFNVRTGALSHMTSSTETTATTPQVAVNDIGNEEAFLAAIDETIKYFNDGDIVDGVIVKVDRDEVLLDIGYKTEGVIPSRELSIKHDVDPNEVVAVGDEIEALVLQKEDKE